MDTVKCIDGCGKMTTKDDVIVIRDPTGAIYQVCRTCYAGGEIE